MTGESYLFIVDYDSDAERKRVEYLFNNADGEITNPAGLVRVARDVDYETLYTQLASKVPSDQISAYRLESADTEIELKSTTVSERVDAPPEAVESFVEYMLSKKKAVLQVPAHNEYEVYTKKGRAEVTYRLSGESTTTVEIRIEGVPDATKFLTSFFEDELRDYADSQRTEDP